MTDALAADVIEQIMKVYGSELCDFDRLALKHAIEVLEKENEPAQSEDCTSSGNNNSQVNDNTEMQKCQEVIKEAKKRLLAIYETLSDEGRIAFELGELYHLLEGRSEEDMQCQ